MATYIRNLVPALLTSGTRHRFLFLWSGSRPPAEFDAWPPNGWTSLRLPGLPKPIFEQALVPLVLLQHRVDVLHLTGGPGGLLMRKLGGPRVVVTVHDVIPLIFAADYLANPLRMLFYRFQLMLSRQADAVITVSDTSYGDLVTRAGFRRERLHVIRAAVPAEPAMARGSGSWRPGAATPFVLVLGGAEPRKNLAMALEAFRRIEDRVPHHLYVAGGRWRNRSPQAATGSIPSARVHFLGELGAAELRSLYTAADLFFFPSLYEGFGLPVLEAMACGTPVLAARAGSLPEVAGAAAEYVDPRDPAAMAEGLFDLLTQPGRRAALIEAGRRHIAQFSWARSAQETLGVYEMAAGDRRATRRLAAPS